jgi:GH25 family lysozyme M1 (1,4-beta-N-acetylmuramidase)
MNYEITGIDVSKWQKELDWQTALRQGISFAFIRSSEGNRQKDAFFEHNMLHTKMLGIPRGIYHYFKPGRDLKMQVDLFSAVINAWTFELDAVVDVETSDGLNKVEFRDRLAAFIHQTEVRTGRKLMIYTNQNIFDNLLPPTDFAWKRRLWIASYTSDEQPHMPAEWRTHGKTWTFWQHSARNGLGYHYGAATKSICLDRFNGVRADFQKLYKLASLPQPPEQPPQEPPADPPAPSPAGAPCYQVISPALHVFSAPRLDAAIVGDLVRGDRVELHDVHGTDEVWMQIGVGKWCLYAYNGAELMQKVPRGA